MKNLKNFFNYTFITHPYRTGTFFIFIVSSVLFFLCQLLSPSNAIQNMKSPNNLVRHCTIILYELFPALPVATLSFGILLILFSIDNHLNNDSTKKAKYGSVFYSFSVSILLLGLIIPWRVFSPFLDIITVFLLPLIIYYLKTVDSE